MTLEFCTIDDVSLLLRGTEFSSETEVNRTQLTGKIKETSAYIYACLSSRHDLSKPLSAYDTLTLGNLCARMVAHQIKRILSINIGGEPVNPDESFAEAFEKEIELFSTGKHRLDCYKPIRANIR